MDTRIQNVRLFYGNFQIFVSDERKINSKLNIYS